MEKDKTKKISKSEAGYKKGLPQAHCAICKNFEPQATGPWGQCQLVYGDIGPSMWCKLFARTALN